MMAVIEEIRRIIPNEHPILGKGILELTDIISSPYPGASVVPALCRATFDRRTLTGENEAVILGQVEEAIARRKQEKEQWGTVLSGLEGGSLSGQPGLTQPGTDTVGGVAGFSANPKDSTILDMGSITVRPSEQPASNPTVWKTFTSNIVKLVGGKQDSKKDDPAPPSVTSADPRLSRRTASPRPSSRKQAVSRRKQAPAAGSKKDG